MSRVVEELLHLLKGLGAVTVLHVGVKSVVGSDAVSSVGAV